MEALRNLKQSSTATYGFKQQQFFQKSHPPTVLVTAGAGVRESPKRLENSMYVFEQANMC